mmetsp:Transcript_22228/g.53856  ORF Transcript_22228/g.53856 Transcript_22228/m.53856 type:complete len:219 (+) Transcript_22228:437-1093(+)
MFQRKNLHIQRANDRCSIKVYTNMQNDSPTWCCYRFGWSRGTCRQWRSHWGGRGGCLNRGISNGVGWNRCDRRRCDYGSGSCSSIEQVCVSGGSCSIRDGSGRSSSICDGSGRGSSVGRRRCSSTSDSRGSFCHRGRCSRRACLHRHFYRTHRGRLHRRGERGGHAHGHGRRFRLLRLFEHSIVVGFEALYFLRGVYFEDAFALGRQREGGRRESEGR